ncbi:MAG: hypothetical protein FJW36_14120 [Acidobacteria bacterium]|nr:hypothetical protein [Acidobacteriota bacterium]
MAAIARRVLFGLLFAPNETTLRDVLAQMATDLSAGNVSGFLKATVAEMPGRDALRQQLAGLTAAYDVTSSLQVMGSSGDDARQMLEVDWYLGARSRTDNAVMLQRRETLKIGMVLKGKRWMVESIQPLEFFNYS